MGKLIHLLKCGETEWEANKKKLGWYAKVEDERERGGPKC